jgi:hypothetical protein
MKYKLFSTVILLAFSVLISSNAFSRIILDDISYDITSWPVYVGDWCEFWTTVAATPKVENLVVIGRVDGAEVFRTTFPAVSTDIVPKASFRWQALTDGSHIIEFIADPDGTFGTPVVRKLTMPVKPADLHAKAVKIIHGIAKEGETVTMEGTFENMNNIRINDTFFVQFMDKTINLKRFEIHGIGPKETMAFKVDVLCHSKYHDIKIIVDSTSVITESNETNNLAVYYLHCLQPRDPGYLTPAPSKR